MSRKFLKSIFTTKSGCGGCRNPKLSDVIDPNSNPPISTVRRNPISGNKTGGLSPEDEPFTYTSTTLSLNSDPESDPNSTRLPSPRFADIVAVEKDSDDPYEDFRRSMLQMINEKKIYSETGLQELLDRFLDLNYPCHHGIILKAFIEIWNGFVDRKLPLMNQRDEMK